MGGFSQRQAVAVPRSKMLLAARTIQGERLAVRELADIAGGDPFLCLRLLREAEAPPHAAPGHETTTTLAAVMQLGSDTFRELLVAALKTDETSPRLAACEARSIWQRNWRSSGAARSDVAPEEVALAALLSEMGELRCSGPSPGTAP